MVIKPPRSDSSIIDGKNMIKKRDSSKGGQSDVPNEDYWLAKPMNTLQTLNGDQRINKQIKLGDYSKVWTHESKIMKEE